MIATVKSLYKFLSDEFDKNNVDDFQLESRYILMKVMDFSYSDFLLRSSESVSDEQYTKALDMMSQRLSGRPIQYILGEWDFYESTYKVGEGVLIPRPETEQLCEIAFELIRDKTNPVLFDLCSGSGCIGITMKKLLPKSTVYLFEKSPAAFEYTKFNSHNICGNLANVLLNADILDFDAFDDLPLADMVLSNPPYIKSAEIPSLQCEVLKEPEMALDGGEDGLIFYRAICKFWTSKLKPDGIIVLECGEEQADDIKEIFNAEGYYAQSYKDFNNIDRIIVVRRIK